MRSGEATAGEVFRRAVEGGGKANGMYVSNGGDGADLFRDTLEMKTFCRKGFTFGLKPIIRSA